MIIWGFRSRGKSYGQIQMACPHCQKQAMTTISQSRRWFALFFIPIFPISSKNTIAVCGLCGYRYGIKSEYAQPLIEQLTNTATSNIPASS